MSDSSASLQHKMNSATDLQSVVRSMKAIAAANVGQYESAVVALDDYYRTVQLGLHNCFRQHPAVAHKQPTRQRIGVLVFGSDQGLVGQFNSILVDYIVTTLAKQPGEKTVWCVGERLQTRLMETELALSTGFILPKSLHAIPSLISEILLEIENRHGQGDISEVLIFHNQPKSGTIYQPFYQRLLPLDNIWQAHLKSLSWPSKKLPEVINAGEETLLAFIHEYLFVSLYRACAESLTSENASRLATMLRAEKTIEEMLATMHSRFHLLRQSNIDEELFDLISSFELLE